MSGAVQPLLSYGGASGPPPSIWSQVSGTLLWPGDQIADIAIFDALHIGVVTASGNGGYSLDGGATWQASTGPIGGNITEAFQIYSNAAGTIGCCIGTDGTSRHIARTTDQGISWADVTPPGADVGFALFYSSTADLFFFFDESNAEVWTSADGNTWINTSTGVNLGVNQNGTRYSLAFQMAENGTDIVVQGFDDLVSHWWLYHSTDGITWTQVLSVPIPVSVTPSNIIWDGSKFITASQLGASATVTLYESNASGTVWTSKSVSSAGNVAPYLGMVGSFGGRVYSAWDSTDSITVASSPDGITWTVEPITITNWADGSFAPSAARLYQVGSGVISSTGGGVWTQELDPLDVGFLASIALGFGLTLVVGNDTSGNGVVWKRN